MSRYTIKENGAVKIFKSPDFNYVFNKVTGFHAQWGRTQEENPDRCPYGPVIADIEVVSMCKGPGSQSLYANERGIVVPCSFMENMQWDPLNSTGWNLLDDSIKNKDEFVEKIWNSNRAINFSHNASLCASCGMGCQIYDV